MSTFDIKFTQPQITTITLDAKDDNEALKTFFEIYPRATVHGISEVVTADNLPKGTHDYV